MDLQIRDHLFIVGGAGSGFGKAIAEGLAAEGARIIAIARKEDPLKALQAIATDQIRILSGDIMQTATQQQAIGMAGGELIRGLVVNAGGPPAKMVMETTLADWDEAYRSLLRWKVELTQSLLPALMDAGYGRILYIESSAVKEPLENLVLSNSLRVAVTGFVKTLSREIAHTGVTMNILAPGSHNTAAIERIYLKKSEQEKVGLDVVRTQALTQIPVGFLGEPADFASLALWLLSPASRYITGETITVDGGRTRGIFG